MNLSKIQQGTRSLWSVIKNSITLRFQDNINLNLGAGGTRIQGYVNVDSLFLRETDLLCELKNLPLFVKKNTVTKIYASHILEHFSETEVKDILKKCYQILQKDGELRISVPDMDKIVKIYNKNWEHFQTKGNAPWNGLIYGGQSSRYDFHKTGFNRNWLSFVLEEIGFRKIQEYDAKQFTQEHNIQDSSLADTPFNEPISLNIIARK